MRKLNCGIIADIMLGILFIALGLFADVEGTRHFNYFFSSLGTALLVWAIIKISLNIGMKCSLCPKCGYTFSWNERWGFNQSDPCPGCQTVLIRAKWPLRIINASTLIFSVLVFVVTVTEFENPLYLYLFYTLLLVDLILTEVGMVTLRYEIVDEPKDPGHSLLGE
jgi:hypothetical protein